MSVVLDIKLKKVNKVYHEGNTIAGVVVVESQNDIKHDGLTLNLNGVVNLRLSPKNVGLIEAFYNSVKPVTLVSYFIEVSGPGKIPSGKTEIPFEATLKPKQGSNSALYETYHGVYVTIQYTLRCDLLRRNFLSKDLFKEIEFFVEHWSKNNLSPKPIEFSISPNSLQNVRKSSIPNFKIVGHLDSTICSINKPFTGQLTVEHTETPIKSVELQLVRVETCGCAEGYARDPTEIQNIQIGEGNVVTGLAIPIYMIFPRLFVCTTLCTTNFKVEFEINLVVLFQDNHLITENFPITLVRS